MKSKFSTTKDNPIRLYVGGHQKTRDYCSNSPSRLSKNMFTGQIGEFSFSMAFLQLMRPKVFIFKVARRQIQML